MTDSIDTKTTPDQRYHERVLLAASRAHQEAYNSSATRRLIVELTGVRTSPTPWTDARQRARNAEGCGCEHCTIDFLRLNEPIDGVSPELITQAAAMFTAVVNREPEWCDFLVEDWWHILQLPEPAPMLVHRHAVVTVRVLGADATDVHDYELRVRPDALTDAVLLLAQVRRRYGNDFDGEIVDVKLLSPDTD